MPSEKSFSLLIDKVQDNISKGAFTIAKKRLINILMKNYVLSAGEKKQLLTYLSHPGLAPKEPQHSDEYKDLSKEDLTQLKLTIVNLVTDNEVHAASRAVSEASAVLALCENSFLGHILHKKNGFRQPALSRGTLQTVASWLNENCADSKEEFWGKPSLAQRQAKEWHEQIVGYPNIATKIGSQQILDSLNKKSLRR